MFFFITKVSTVTIAGNRLYFDLNHSELDQLLSLSRLPSDTVIKIYPNDGSGVVNGRRIDLNEVTDKTFAEIERLTAEDEGRLITIKRQNIDKFLDRFAALSEHAPKQYRLPYSLWRAIKTSQSDIYVWKDQFGGKEYVFGVNKLAFRVDNTSYFNEALKTYLSDESLIKDEILYKVQNNETIYKVEDKNKKENESMNIKPNMNFDFGPCGDGIAMSPYGLAIKSNNTWLTYDPSTNKTVDVNGIVFHMKGMIYKIPVAIASIQVGDLIIHQGKSMYVTSTENQKIEAVDILASEAKTIIPVTNMFGFNFITKVTSLMSTNMMGKPSTDQPFGNIMPMLLMSQMFGEGSGDGIFGEDFVKMMMFSSMCGGGANPFGAMFNLGDNSQG